jgi:hypothetical protein
MCDWVLRHLSTDGCMHLDKIKGKSYFTKPIITFNKTELLSNCKAVQLITGKIKEKFNLIMNNMVYYNIIIMYFIYVNKRKKMKI